MSKTTNLSQPACKVPKVVALTTATNTNPVQLEAASSLSPRKALLGVHACRVGGTPGVGHPGLSAAGQGPGQGDPGVWVSIVFVPSIPPKQHDFVKLGVVGLFTLRFLFAL